jgi:putative tryptophan/tyrosine transport system substrate-binding protein
MPVIGFLVAGTPLSHGQWVAAFVQRLRELGWIEGRTIAIEYRWGEGRNERFAEIAAEFVRRKVDVIVTSATAAVVAAKQATSVIPIVFAAAGDPVGTGLVASLARPGGNVTGLSIQQPDVAAKRLELLREVVPSLGRLATLGNVGGPAVVLDMREVQAAARTLGLDVITLEIRRGEDIVPAFEALNGRVEALYVVIDPLVDKVLWGTRPAKAEGTPSSSHAGPLDTPEQVRDGRNYSEEFSKCLKERIASLQSWSAAAGCCRAHGRQAAVEAEMDPTLLAE